MTPEEIIVAKYLHLMMKAGKPIANYWDWNNETDGVRELFLYQARHVISKAQLAHKSRPDREKIFSTQALLAAVEEGRREGKVDFIRGLRRNSKYKLMQKTASGKYYENLLERDWLELAGQIQALFPDKEECNQLCCDFIADEARKDERRKVGQDLSELVTTWGSDLVTIPFKWIENLKDGQALKEAK